MWWKQFGAKKERVSNFVGLPQDLTAECTEITEKKTFLDSVFSVISVVENFLAHLIRHSLRKTGYGLQSLNCSPNFVIRSRKMTATIPSSSNTTPVHPTRITVESPLSAL